MCSFTIMFQGLPDPDIAQASQCDPVWCDIPFKLLPKPRRCHISMAYDVLDLNTFYFAKRNKILQNILLTSSTGYF